MTIRGTKSTHVLALLLLVPSAAGLAFATACSSSSSSDSPGGDAGGADTGGPTVEGGSDAPEDAADAGPVDRIGAVFAISDTSTVDGGTKSSFRAGASFTHVTTPDGTTKTKTVGPCVLETVGSGTMAVEEDLSAGIVHIAGGTKALDLSPQGDKTYNPVTGSTALWSGGETLTASAPGKDVPAFTTSLVAPGKITLSAPLVPAGGNLVVTRSAGVNATFSGVSRGTVVLYFDIATAQEAFTATCTFDASAGTGKIPAAAFADFPAGDGTFDFYVKEASVVTPPGWQVRFTVSKALVDTSGATLAGQATFQ